MENYTDRIVIEGRRKGSHLPDPDNAFMIIKDVSKYIKLHRFLQNIEILMFKCNLNFDAIHETPFKNFILAVIHCVLCTLHSWFSVYFLL